jgi:hypothetical protein
MMSQRMEAGTQARQSPGIQYRMPGAAAQNVVRESARAGTPASPAREREKKPNGDPCSLTLWGAEEE